MHGRGPRRYGAGVKLLLENLPTSLARCLEGMNRVPPLGVQWQSGRVLRVRGDTALDVLRAGFSARHSPAFLHLCLAHPPSATIPIRFLVAG